MNQESFRLGVSIVLTVLLFVVSAVFNYSPHYYVSLVGLFVFVTVFFLMQYFDERF